MMADANDYWFFACTLLIFIGVALYADISKPSQFFIEEQCKQPSIKTGLYKELLPSGNLSTQTYIFVEEELMQVDIDEYERTKERTNNS